MTMLSSWKNCTVCCRKISECDRARVFCTQIKKADLIQNRPSAINYVRRFFSTALFLHDFSIPSHAAARSNPGWPVAMHALIQPLRWKFRSTDHACMHLYWILWVTETKINACMIWLLAVWDRYLQKMPPQRASPRSVATLDGWNGFLGDFWL